MKAAIFEAPKTMRIGNWVTPTPGPDEVLVTVRAVGVCAGDTYIYQGRNPYVQYPIIGGHEICGTIAALGANVRGKSAGQRVVVEPFLGCGSCYPCRIGKSNCCVNLRIIGMHLPGGFAESVVAPASHVHVVPDGLTDVVASLAEPVAIGVQASWRGEVRAGELVLVMGCGPIGLALIEVVRARGAIPIATDIVESRLEFARSLGAETIKADAELPGAIMARTNGEGAPVVIEATGNAQAIEQSVDLVASGGRIVVVSLVRRGVTVQMPALDFTRKEMTIVGSRASVNCFPEALELLAAGKIGYAKAATVFNLWDAPSVFAGIDEKPGALHKAVFVRE